MNVKILKITSTLFLLILIIFSLLFIIFYNSKTDLPEKEIIFTVEKGQSAQAIGKKLSKKNLIRYPMVFNIGYRLFFRGKTLKAGEYRLDKPYSVKELLTLLTEGKVYLHPVTVPEGLTRIETAHLLAESLGFFTYEDFLEASADPALIKDWDSQAIDLEGYLFPETYHFPKGTKAKDVVKAMIKLFKEIYAPKWKKRTEEIGLSIREVVILASLIEKETSLKSEKKLVSAVFHNRLRKRMKLDCDPTIIYALKLENKYNGRLGWKDLKLDSPYNTYLYPGLPPGPIANPGRDSLEAALYPAEVSYLYFVSKNDGSHIFSETLREHQKNVIKYQINK